MSANDRIVPAPAPGTGVARPGIPGGSTGATSACSDPSVRSISRMPSSRSTIATDEPRAMPSIDSALPSGAAFPPCASVRRSRESNVSTSMLSVSGTKRQSATRTSPPFRPISTGGASSAADAVNSLLSRPPVVPSVASEKVNPIRSPRSADCRFETKPVPAGRCRGRSDRRDRSRRPARGRPRAPRRRGGSRVARKSSMCSCVNTGSPASPCRSVRKIVSPSAVPRCRRNADSGGVRNVSLSVDAGSGPQPLHAVHVTV